MKCLLILTIAAVIQLSLGATPTEGSTNAAAAADAKSESGGIGSAINGLLSKFGIHFGGSSDNGAKADSEGDKAGSEAGASSSGPDSKAPVQSEAEVSSAADGLEGAAAVDSCRGVEVKGPATQSEGGVSTKAGKSRSFSGRTSSQSGALASSQGGGLAASSSKADVYGDEYSGHGRHGGHGGYGGSAASSNAMAGYGY